jgi:RNA polymerase subunit RPABC4/transcription elongation factor Spt4
LKDFTAFASTAMLGFPKEKLSSYKTCHACFVCHFIVQSGHQFRWQKLEKIMPLDPTFVSSFILILAAFSGAFLVALWMALIVWAYRDIRNRARDPLAHVLSVLVVMILFIPGVLVYLILRPQRTLEEEYQRTLEEEALLTAIEEQAVCPGCERRTKEDWQVCPNCQTRLRKPCHHCGRLMELPWNICPYCGTPAPGMRRETTTVDEALRELEQKEETPPEVASSPDVTETTAD